MNNEEIANFLEEIKVRIREAMYEAQEILRDAPNLIRERAKSYWMSQNEIAIDEDHDWLAGCMCTMENTIDELRSVDEEIEED